MKTEIRRQEASKRVILAVLVSSFLLHHSCVVHADSNINNPNDDSYGANVGWMSWRADAGANGVAVGEYWLSGFIYGANVGWIKVGATNVPPNNTFWQNSAATNFGVNVFNTGELRGLAYGANIGWIVFTNMTAAGPLAVADVPRLNFTTGNFTGFAYGANVGWINLSNAFGFVKANSITNAPDTDLDGIADAFEITYAGNLPTLTSVGDADGDGKSDVDEYLADTNPLDSGDSLRITAISAAPPGNTSTLTWTSEPSRLYQIQSNSNIVNAASWANTSGLVPADFGPTTTRSDTQTATSNRFYRVQAKKPLSP